LWSLLDPARVSKRVAAALEDPANELWLSPISVWEALMLAERKRVLLTPDPESWIRESLEQVPFREASLNHEIAIESQSVDLDHDDPADRFLGATARVYDLTLVTADRRLFKAKRFSVLRHA
jgi:PIN domain nuclease of toxin-antitoxin system